MKYAQLVINRIYLSVFAGFLMVTNSAWAAEVKLYNTPPSADEVRQALLPKTRIIVPNFQQSAPTPASSTPANDASSPGVIAVQLRFPYKSAEIPSDQSTLIDPIGEVMAGDTTKKSQIIIEGHTDGAGSDSYNRALSERRAQAAKQYLTSKYRIEPNRIIAVGKGESELLVKDNPLDGRNRRIEFRRK